MSSDAVTPSRTRWLGWAVAYLAFLALVIWGCFAARQSALATFGTPAAQAEWDAWRAAAAEQAESGPVRRKVPKSTEPPALVLMRDYFGVVLSAAVVFGSVLFALLALFLRVATRPSPPPANPPSF